MPAPLAFVDARLSLAILALMKSILLVVLALVFTMTTATFAADAAYRHVVFFKFKDSATPEQVQGLEKDFIELAKKIDTVKAFEWGTNVSPEGLNDGFTHCFFVTFADKAGLEVYLPHAAHQEFVSKLKPQLDKVCVLDYVTK
jgi:hypothetical protein